MDVNLSSMSGMQSNSASCGRVFDLQGAMRPRHHNLQQEMFPGLGSQLGFTNNVHENIGSSVNREQMVSAADVGKPMSDDGEHSFMEEVSEGQNDANESKKGGSQWHRVKWSDSMVKLLVTAVSYTNEEAAAECAGGQRRKMITLQKKGKWKAISKVMADRGYFVSPQQCEDKFNDLNKKYKRLNDLLGRGTSCEIVENPSLLDMVDHISEKAKEEVKRILSSKHLHYEEMCSYHNGNRLHLPPDPELGNSLRVALMLRDDHDDEDNDMKCHLNDDNGEGDHSSPLGSDKRVDDMVGSSNKRAKHTVNSEHFIHKGFGCFHANDPKRTTSGFTQAPQEQWTSHTNLQLEEQRLQIQEQMAQLEKERLKWLEFCMKEDEEFEGLKIEIQRMKVENERMALELKQKEMLVNATY